PLNGVIGMLELLLGRSLPPEAAGQVRAARRSASSLLTLVDDLLDIAKIEAGRLELQRRPVNLSALVEEVSEVVAAAAADRGLELRVGVGDEVPSAVLGDGGRLRQLLVNLLGNAVKFTDEGHVGLEVDLVAPVRGGTAPLAFTVTDTGAGIDPEVVPTLFEAFTQADQSATRRVGGTGLGLAIVRQLTELMDGRISVDSEPGVGSTFRLELDLEVAAGTPDEDAAASRSTRAPAPELRRVLVVEDNDVNQQLAQAHLEDLGCEVTVVADGEVGAATALSGAYDLVLMDCLMPGVDGFEATRRIRAAEPPDRRTPIIAVTADATFEHATVCRGAGMDDVLAKPYGRADLAAVLERHEVPPPGPARAHDAASSDDDGDGGSGPVQVPLGDDEVVFDPRPLELLRRDVADARLVERVLRSYADRAPDLLEQLAAGLAAGEPAVVSSNCHALVASSAAVGAVLVERLARRVDGAATDGVGAQRRVAEQQDLVAELRSAVARTVDEHGRYLDRLAAHR
ncbi:MAG: ATP-binding protein, partial [Nitriliruptoraceae bacterium]